MTSRSPCASSTVLIRDTDKRIREAFEETFAAAAANFEEVVGRLFPGGRGRLRLVREDAGPRPVLGGADEGADAEARPGEVARTISGSRSSSRPRARPRSGCRCSRAARSR